jgi:hypothetical protein
VRRAADLGLMDFGIGREDAVADVLAGNNWNRVPVTSRVQVSYGEAPGDFSAVLQGDRLADAVFARIPVLKRGKPTLTAKPRKLLELKVYKSVQHLKGLPPVGGIDRSVMVTSMRASAVLPTIAH